MKTNTSLYHLQFSPLHQCFRELKGNVLWLLLLGRHIKSHNLGFKSLSNRMRPNVERADGTDYFTSIFP